MNITGIVLTKNEEKNIERAILSLDFCDEIIVVDDGSTDNTIGIIQSSKVKVQILNHEIKNSFSAQRNWAMEQATNEWILFLDADEEISSNLKTQISKLQLKSLNSEYSLFYLKRRDYFWNHEMKYGETLKLRNIGLVRLMKKGSGAWVGKVHEEFISDRAQVHRVGVLGAYINHYPHPTLKEFISDINIYSSIRAQELHEAHIKAGTFEMIIYPVSKFILNYFFYLGFFDGPPGFVYSFLMSFHSFLVRSKLYQLNAIKQP